MFSGKKILLGITGSIAAYKSLQILRDLTAAGAEVQVVLTQTAARFIPPLTLQVFSGRPVLSDLFEADHEMAHLALAESVDLVLIAPVTAHFVAKMAAGFSDDLLSTLLLATSAPVVIAPAMDLGMWAHPATQNNISVLKKRGVLVIGPEVGPLASGKTGAGRFSDEKEIINRVADLLSANEPIFRGKVILVTAGPTQEAIDPVRFISNRSSGKMGYALAAAAHKSGARVILVSGPTALPVPIGVEPISVRTADEMKKVVYAHMPEVDVFIMAAAVSDYRPRVVSVGKIKKNGLPQAVELEETTDILAERPEGKRGQIVVGFAAETENVIENAQKKLKRKRLDLIIANDVTEEGAGFDVDTNIVHLLTASGKRTSCPKMSKQEIAELILKAVAAIPYPVFLTFLSSLV